MSVQRYFVWQRVNDWTKVQSISEHQKRKARAGAFNRLSFCGGWKLANHYQHSRRMAFGDQKLIEYTAIKLCGIYDRILALRKPA
jgi:hypothetical protein